jgi:hypothetical protein
MQFLWVRSEKADPHSVCDNDLRINALENRRLDLPLDLSLDREARSKREPMSKPWILPPPGDGGDGSTVKLICIPQVGVDSRLGATRYWGTSGGAHAQTSGQ